MKPLFSGEKLHKSVAACIFSAMVTAAVLAILATSASWSTQPSNRIATFLWVLSVGFIVILIHLLLIALPIQSILQRLRLTDYFTNMLAAAVCVFGLFVFYGQYDWLGEDEGFVPFPHDLHDLIKAEFLGLYGICLGIALVIGTPAWLFRRPDLDKPLATKPGTLKAVQ